MNEYDIKLNMKVIIIIEKDNWLVELVLDILLV